MSSDSELLELSDSNNSTFEEYSYDQIQGAGAAQTLDPYRLAQESRHN